MTHCDSYKNYLIKYIKPKLFIIIILISLYISYKKIYDEDVSLKNFKCKFGRHQRRECRLNTINVKSCENLDCTRRALRSRIFGGLGNQD